MAAPIIVTGYIGTMESYIDTLWGTLLIAAINNMNK